MPLTTRAPMTFPVGGKVAADGRFYGTVEERFWHYANPVEDGCWIWSGVLNEQGYGRVHRRDGSYVFAHRFAYELLVAGIPDGLVLDHLCRTPSCVNPDHLEPVTQAENTRRGVPRNAKTTHCPQGHEYTPDNTYRPPGAPNKRVCRTCAKGKPGGSQFRQRRRNATTLEG